MWETVDLIVLSRTSGRLHPRVQSGIDAQSGVKTRIHRVVGKPLPEDGSKWETIARVRNIARRRGSSRWAMFLDDDVVLGPDCVRKLLAELKENPSCAAVGAPYLFQSNPFSPPSSDHVTMGATLFRRSAFSEFRFRASATRCDCSCCCEDLAKQMLQIRYCLEAQARHIDIGLHDEKAHTTQVEEKCPRAAAQHTLAAEPVILAAFDRRDVKKFRKQFLGSLRRNGGNDKVIAVTYGLTPRELRSLEAHQVSVVAMPANKVSPARRRMRDFQVALNGLPLGTPVAYWDAGDVVFQNDLSELWEIVQSHPDKLLVTTEAGRIHPSDGVMAHWIQSIVDKECRKEVLSLLCGEPILNSGFAAGTVAVMTEYLRRANALRDSKLLLGSMDWGDQVALNVYCRSDLDRFMQVDCSWNYVVFARNDADAYFSKGGYYRCLGKTVNVVHGAGGSLRRIPGYVEFCNDPFTTFS